MYSLLIFRRLQEGENYLYFFFFLPKELVTEKERNNLVTAKMRERINTLEKEHGTFQSKMHVGYQEAQQFKIKVHFHQNCSDLSPSANWLVL